MHNKTRQQGFFVCVGEASGAVEEKRQESLCSLIQNRAGHTHAAASIARLVLEEQFGYAIKACKLKAQQNNSPSLIPA